MAILTRKQFDTLNYIKLYHQDHGIMPTLKEIAGHFTIGIATAQYYVNKLEERHVIKKYRNLERGIEII